MIFKVSTCIELVQQMQILLILHIYLGEQQLLMRGLHQCVQRVKGRQQVNGGEQELGQQTLIGVVMMLDLSLYYK